jgi:hypothetical protein
MLGLWEASGLNAWPMGGLHNMNENLKTDLMVTKIIEEMGRATREYGAFRSTHEGYAVIKEELEELWEEIKKNNAVNVNAEALQLAAMTLKFLVDFGFDN